MNAGCSSNPSHNALCSDAPVFDFHTLPGHLIRRLQQIALAIFAEETKPFGITTVQYAALKAIQASPGLDQIRLAGLIAYDRTTIGGVVERLEKKGLIERHVGPTDRRTRLLTLTAAGSQMLTDIEPAVIRVQARLLEPLDPDTRNCFMRAITQMVDSNNELSRAPFMRDERLE